MASPSTIISRVAFLFALFTPAVHGSWRMFASTMVTARVDPLISPGAVSGHVHDVVGGNNFAVNYDYDSQRASSCSSVEIQEDKSAYWTPAVYYKGRDGSFKLLPSSYVVYYLHRGPAGTQKGFPAGFRMIAGNANKNTLTPGNAEDEAINFHCLGPDTEMLQFPDQACPGGVRVQILFPSCWNGRDVTSNNFKDHVVYPLDGKEGNTCPDTHPVRLITLFLEHIVDTSNIDWYPGSLMLSEGDNVGWSSHADFIMGWDEAFLQQAVDQCTDPYANLGSCGLLMNHDDDHAGRGCQPTQNLPLEDVGFYGTISDLLGDNAIWGGGVAKVSKGSSNTPPLAAPFSVVKGGWTEHGCINEGDPYVNTLTGDSITDDNMSPQMCIKNCESKGFTLAGLEGGNGCLCGNQLDHNGSMNVVDSSNCRDKCSGSFYEWCGGGRNLRLFTKSGDASADSAYPYPPVGSRLAQVYTDNGNITPAVSIPASLGGGTLGGSSTPARCTSRSKGKMRLARKAALDRKARRNTQEKQDKTSGDTAAIQAKRSSHHHNPRSRFHRSGLF